MVIPPEINIGNITIHFYGLIIAASILIGWYLAKKRTKYYKIPLKIFGSNTLLIPLFLGIVGGRLYHVIDLWPYYWANPQLIVRVDLGGLGIFGALAGIIVGFIVVAKIEKIKPLPLLDLISPSLLIAQAIGRLGNYINGEGYGPPTNVPWAVEINGVRVHPTFFYEAIIDVIFFFALLALAKRLKKPGQLFGFYLILYSLGRFVVEFWRIDTATFNSFKTAQILSVATLLIGIYLVKFRAKLGVDTS